MKNLNVILSRTVLIGLMTLLVACVDKKKEDNTEVENHHDQEMHDGEMHHDGEMEGGMKHDDTNHDMSNMSKISVKESKTASALIDDYLAIKNALVKDHKDVAAKAAVSLGKSVANFDIKAVEKTNQEGAREILDGMKVHAEHISKMDIAHQRTHFAEITADMKNLLAITGSDRMLYQQHCPMFADNKGGAWLSASQEIKNPLFGSQMLKCGSVKQTIVLQ